MNRKLKLRKMIGGISVDLKTKREGFSTGFKVVMSALLAWMLSFVISSIFNLSDPARWGVMIGLCVVASTIVSLRPRLLLTVACIMLAFMGGAFIIGALFEELRSQIKWDPGLLGAGASLVAIAIAMYALLIQTEQKEGGVNMGESGRSMDNLKEGYVWLDETRKYRCEYCRRSGKRHCCKTLGGIERHIASKHG